jgi:hypothetical protein
MLCFFARVDFFWLVVVIGLWLLVTARAGLRPMALFAGIAVSVVVPYLIWNARFHGSIVPISGRVKKFYLALHHPTFTSYLDSDEWWGLPRALTDVFFPAGVGIAIRLPITIAMLGGVVMILRWLRKSDRLPIEISLLTVTIGLHTLFMYFYYRELRVSTFYYFTPQVIWFWLVVTLFLTCMANRSAEGVARRRFPYAVVGLFVIGAIISWYLALPRPQAYWSQRLELARDIRRVVPEGEAIGAFWPGIFAQFSQRRVVPMDGIIGSESYFETYVKQNEQLRYLREQGIRYVAIYWDESPDRLLAGPRFRPSTWHRLGQLRMWEAREHVVESVSSRPLSRRGDGWYLMRLDWDSPTQR